MLSKGASLLLGNNRHWISVDGDGQEHMIKRVLGSQYSLILVETALDSFPSAAVEK